MPFTRILTGAALCAAPHLSYSETVYADLEVVHLDDYLVETNPATYRLKAPAVTHQIMGDDLRALNLPETGDALQHLPNLFIRKRFIGDKNALTSIRGTSNRQPGRTLVYADGILLSNFLGTGFGNSPRWFLVAPEEIEKIAVSYGPYSAIYAGNSIGGTVLFTTKLPSKLTSTVRVQSFVQNFTEYGTDRDYVGRSFYASVGDRKGRLSYFAFLNRLENDSHPMTFATVNESQTTAGGQGALATTGALRDTDFSGNARLVYGSAGSTEAIHDLLKLKLGLDVTESLHLRYTAMYWQNQEKSLSPETYLHDSAGQPVWAGRVELGGRTYTIPANAFSLSRRYQADLVNAVTVAHEPTDGLQAAVTASWYDVLKDKGYASSSALPLAANGGGGQATIIGRTGWQSVDAVFGWHGTDSFSAAHAPAFGYHYDRYFTRQNQWAMTDWTRDEARTSLSNGNGGRTRTHALFAQDAWRITQALSLTLGVRWEDWEAAEGFRARDVSGNRLSSSYPARNQNAWSPKLAVAYRFTPAFTSRLSLARAVRFPTVGELFQGSLSTTGSLTQNDPNLKPERDLAKDLTLEHALAGGGTARMSVFEEDVHDALISQSTLRPDGTTFSGVQNVRRVRTRGAEAAVQARETGIEGLTLDASLSYTRSVILENPGFTASVGKQFPRIPRWQVKAIATYAATRSLSLSAAARYSSYQYNTLDNSDPFGGYGGTDSFFVADLKATWSPLRMFTLSAGVDNVNDRRYHVFHPMPGRTWVAELRWTF
ncbi:MAG: TonB-dependent receptor [Opitutaceae bacterium]|nr:TonB-dependent receptor [Opitutaceae bacterium]